MAQVPTITAPTLTPPPEINPRIAGQPGQVMAGAAEQLGELAEYGERETSLLKKAQDEGIVLAAQNHIVADRQNAETQLEKWTDYTHSDQLKQQTADTLMDKYAEQYGNRPDLWRVIQPYLGQELNHFNAVVDRRANVLTTDFNQAALFDSVNMGIQEAAVIPSLAGQQLVWVNKSAQIDAMHRNGSISALEAEKEKERLVTGTIEAKVAIASNQNNSPETMQAAINQLDEYEGKDYVPEVRLSELRDKLVKAKDVAVARSGKNETLQKVDTYIMGAEKDPTNIDSGTQHPDYTKIAQKAEDDPSLSPEERRGIREEAEHREALQNKSVTDRNHKQYEQWSPHVEDTKHPLTRTQIDHMEQIPDHNSEQWIAPEVANQLRRDVRQFMREQKADGLAARQETAYKSAETLREAELEPGYFISESEVFKAYPGLSKADAKTLFVSKNINGAKEIQDAYKMMNASPIYPMTDAGNAKLAADKEALRETVDGKKLTGQQVIDEAERMIKPQEEAQKQQKVKLLLDNVQTHWYDIFTGGSSEGAQFQFTPQQGGQSSTTTPPQAPTTRKEYFDGMKKANPSATDSDINKYLDGKGIK
jgi:hypothetical protein